MKLEIIEKMKNSESIEELNCYLIDYLNNVAVPDAFCELNGINYIYSKTDTMKLFKMKKYNLYNYWSYELAGAGIPTDLSDYPKIQEMVNELRMLNKKSAVIHKKFNTHRKAELKRIKNESPEFQEIKSQHDNILEQIRLLEEKRHLIQTQYTSWRDTTVKQIEKDAGFIDPNIRISELNKKLK